MQKILSNQEISQGNEAIKAGRKEHTWDWKS